MNIRFLFLFFLMTVSSFAQTKADDIDKAIQLIEIYDGVTTYDTLLKSRLENISDPKQIEYCNKVVILITLKKTEITTYLSKRFTQKEIDKVYDELSNESLFVYSQKTISFIKEWRTKRRELEKSFKTICDSYR